MKKTLSMIYRLGYIVFFLWAMFENAFLSYDTIFSSFSRPESLTNFICFLCILAVFIFSVLGNIPKVLMRIKAVCTALAVFILAVNLPVWFFPERYGWLLKVMLPALMFLDWLIFDKKGSFKLLDVLFMLLGIALLYLLWSALNGNLFDLDGLINFLGGYDNILNTILFTLGAGALMFLLDKLFSGKGSKNLWDLFSLVYRIAFLCITGWAMSAYSGKSLHNLFFGLRRFEILFCFLSFLCILLVIIMCIVRLRSFSSKTPFPRIKGGFTAAAVLILVWRFALFNESLSQNPVTLIFTFVCPLMMILDWILFDAKGKFHAIDPLIWSIPCILYFVITYFTNTLLALYPSFQFYSTETTFALILLGIPAVSYVVYLVDICFKRR